VTAGPVEDGDGGAAQRWMETMRRSHGDEKPRDEDIGGSREDEGRGRKLTGRAMGLTHDGANT
jgi:hypothetical protein